MKIIHSSDWHLGRTFHGEDLTPAHQMFIDDLVDVTQRVRPDALLISGDFFDRSVPGNLTVDLGRYALERLTDLTPVIVTAGNHDSGVRLGWLTEFLDSRLVIRADIESIDDPVYVRCMERDEDGVPLPGQTSHIVQKTQVADLVGRGVEVGVIYPLPYLHPDSSRHTLEKKAGTDTIARSHQAVMSTAMDLVADNYRSQVLSIAPQGLPTVVAAHVFVTGGTETDSERNIEVGGVSDVAAETFVRYAAPDGTPDDDDTGFVDYVALGHLHRPQVLSQLGGPAMAYCGSPLAFSFSEADYTKTQLIVDVTHGQPAVLTPIPTPVYRHVYRLADRLDNLTAANYPKQADGWVHVTVTDPRRPMNMYGIVRSEFPHAIGPFWEPEGDRQTTPDATQQRTGRSVVETIEAFVEDVSGVDLSPQEHAVVVDVAESVRDARHGQGES